jgi:HEAT repeat protein
VKNDDEWTKFKSALWNDLWGKSEDKRADAVRKLGKANYIEAVKVLVDVAKLPNPNLYELEQKRLKVLKQIENIVKCVVKNKGMISLSEKSLLENLQARLKEYNRRFHKEALVKREVVQSLGNTTNADAVAWLCEKAIRDKKMKVRQAVAEAFGYMTDKKSLAALHDVVADKEPSVRSTALDALGRRHDEASLEFIFKGLEDEAWQVRAAAVAAIKMFHDLKMVDPLIKALKNEEGRLRGDIDGVLEKLLGRSMGGDHELWKSWWAANKAKILGGGSTDPHGGDKGAAVRTTSFYGIRTYSKNIMFIIDVSGSMQWQGTVPESEKKKGTGTVITGGKEKNEGPEPIGQGPEDDKKISIAKWELKKAVRSLDKGALFNIIHYSSEVNVYSPKMVKSTRKARMAVYKFIDGLQAVGGTNIHDALMKAFQLAGEGKRAAKKNYKSSVDTIFFLTDGYATAGSVLDPERILHAVKEENRTRKIIIHTIGIYTKDKKQEEDPSLVARWKRFLKQLAEQNGGRHKCFE